MITPENLYDRTVATAASIRKRTEREPRVAIILGTGLGGLGREIKGRVEIPYDQLPDFPLSTVESHTGRLVCGRLAGKDVVAMEGRFHLYEGYSALQVTFGVRVMHALGARTLVVSCACGGLDPTFERGDLMLICDHINLMGTNPLIGFNDERLGPRFPDMSAAYTPALLARAQSLAVRHRIKVQTGVYVSVVGPNLETRAEYRFLRAIGANAVGMSTTPEVTVARHMGMDILGVSVVTDMCLPDALAEAKVEDIIATARRAEPRLTELLSLVIDDLPSDGHVARRQGRKVQCQ